jgi:surface carbohydrate biosynthesis protein
LARIYINIEIQKREFDGRFLLALIAAERGHTVLLGNLKPLLRKGLLAPGIILDKSLTPRPEKLLMMKNSKERGFLVTSIDEESGILQGDYSAFAKKRYSEESLRLADAVFFWGPHDFGHMNEAFPAFRDRFHVTGNPRVDIWRSELTQYFSKANPNPRPYVLLPSNFSSIFSRDDLAVSIKRLCRMGYIEENAVGDAWEARTYRYWQEGVELGWEFITAFRRLARQFPALDFIVRPHPTESPDLWRQLLRPRENLSIKSEGSISPWIRHARVVVNHGCTSALETALSGVPLVSYEPAINHNSDLVFPKRLGLCARTYDELETAVSEVVCSKHRNTTSSDLAVLSTRLAAITGRFAAERIVDIWDALDNPLLRKGDLWSDEPGSRLRVMPYRVDAYKLLSMAGFGPQNWTSWKFPPFDQREVLEAKSLFVQTLRRFEKVPVSLLGPRIIRVG